MRARQKTVNNSKMIYYVYFQVMDSLGNDAMKFHVVVQNLSKFKNQLENLY